MIVVIVLSYLLRRQKSLAKLFTLEQMLAADMVGIPSDRLTIYTFVASGFFAAVAGLIRLTAKSESASPISYEGMEMRYIAAAVIGGASISGGQGSVVGSVLGFLLVVLSATA